MKPEIKTYIDQISPERKEWFLNLLNCVQSNLPEGFEVGMQYNMPTFFVPHSKYPAGYHCNPKDPLPFLSLATQKNSINLYHMGIYALPDLYDWFVTAYASKYKPKLDIGKSCMRFKKEEATPFDLIAELAQKITVDQWISTYEKAFKK